MTAREIEVHVDLEGRPRRVGTLWTETARGRETATFQYHPNWLAAPDRFALEPALPAGTGSFVPGGRRAMFGSLGDSAPDTWGRRLMQRAERRAAAREHRTVCTLTESDYLLGVSDVSRLGALRFREAGDGPFLAASDSASVPPLVELPRLLGVTDRLHRNEETDEDVRLLFAPGSSLGGARPKASVRGRDDGLWIAKLPKPDDDYSVERWEAVAMDLASAAGIRVPEHELLEVSGRPALVTRRFDREGGDRVPFLSALAMLGLEDGDRASYPEIVDAMRAQGNTAGGDAGELFRRVAFNVLVSNVDDHLRNHGFLWRGADGWRLSPAYDLNPVPQDVKARILSTNIDLDEGTCSLDLLRGSAGYFGLSAAEARSTVSDVAGAVADWREAAARRGAPAAEIRRMESAFEHADLREALADRRQYAVKAVPGNAPIPLRADGAGSADRRRAQAELKPLSDAELLERLRATVDAIASVGTDRRERLRLEFSVAVGRDELERRGLQRPTWLPASDRTPQRDPARDRGR